MPVTWSDEKLILLYCPGRGSNSRPSAHRGFKHGQGVPRPYSLGHGGGDGDGGARERRRGRPKWSWLVNLRNDLSKRELSGEKAKDRVQRRRLIRNIDPT